MRAVAGIFSENDRKLAWLVFLITLTTYLLTMPATVALEDDGFFIMSSYFNGVSHPPGYPVHSLLGYLVTHLLPGSVAQRAHALSSLFGALTVLVIFKITLQITSKTYLALFASLSCAFSLGFWSQSIITEVYTLNSFLCFVSIWLILQLNISRQNRDDKRTSIYYLLTGITAGIAFSNHWPLFVLSVPGIVMFYNREREDSARHVWVLIVPMIVVVFLAYLWMVFRSQVDPLFSFTGPIDSLRDVFATIGRSRYQELDVSNISGLNEKIQYAWYFVQQYSMQFSIISIVLSMAGFMFGKTIIQYKYFYGLLMLFVGNSFLLLLLLGYEYTDWHMAVMSVYHVSAYASASIIAALGFEWLLKRIEIYRSGKIIDNKIIYSIVFLLVIHTFFINVQENNRSQYNFAEQYALAIINELPENAILFTESDASAGPVGYLHYIEKVRPDISVMNSKGLLYKNRLYDPKDNNQETKKRILENFITASSRPVFSVEKLDGFSLTENGLFFRVDGKGTKNKYISPGENIVRFYYEHVFSRQYHDAWTRLLVNELKIRFIPYIIVAMNSDQTHFNRHVSHLAEATSNLEGALALVRFLDKNRGQASSFDPAKLDRLIDEKYATSVNRRTMSDYWNYKAGKALSLKQLTNADIYIKKSLQLNPGKDNEAFQYKDRLESINSANKS